MECIEARALKSSFLSESSMKPTQQAFIDELLSVNGINGVSCDDFSVDVFLDLSNEDFKDMFVEQEESEEDKDEKDEKDSLSVSSQDRVEDNSYSLTTFSGTDELAVPVDDLENLEWLSQFVDDSVSELSPLSPVGSFNEQTGSNSLNRSETANRPAIQRTPVLCFPSLVPAKARSKRSRPSGGAWSCSSMSLSESSSSTTSSSTGSSPTSVFIFPNTVQAMEIVDRIGKPPVKKQKNKKTAVAETGGSQNQRRCSHCQVQKTPQWRTGPLGAKTLCNACGVRYKSGRLFPEYRPACSPTFSGDIHSNSHRKVLEMRQKKEVAGAESALTSTVWSF
ncbi:hypothetical protein ACSBR2_019505 [Camellia fascicularis]